MDKVQAVHPEDMDCSVQCGVIRQRLNADLRASSLIFPVDLGAHATLGGMAATRASGTTTVRYGSMRKLVLGLTVVLPDGRIMKTGGRAQAAAGYERTHLFVGGRGTLGVITELNLRLAGIPRGQPAGAPAPVRWRRSKPRRRASHATRTRVMPRCEQAWPLPPTPPPTGSSSATVQKT